MLKTDDDVFVNVRNLLKFVVENRKPNLLIGTLQCGAVPIRDPHNKWYAPKYMIEAAVYPNYLSGTAYLMSRSMAQVTTGWGGHLFRRFCNMFSKSSPCLLGQHGSCSLAQRPVELYENS